MEKQVLQEELCRESLAMNKDVLTCYFVSQDLGELMISVLQSLLLTRADAKVEAVGQDPSLTLAWTQVPREYLSQKRARL